MTLSDLIAFGALGAGGWAAWEAKKARQIAANADKRATEREDREAYLFSIRWDAETKQIVVTNRGHRQALIFDVELHDGTLKQDVHFALRDIEPNGGTARQRVWDTENFSVKAGSDAVITWRPAGDRNAGMKRQVTCQIEA